VIAIRNSDGKISGKRHLARQKPLMAGKSNALNKP